MVSLRNAIARISLRFKRGYSSRHNSQCRYMAPGIFECGNIVVILLAPSSYSYRLEEFDGIELAHRLRKFIEIACYPGCIMTTITMGKRLEVSDFLKKLDRDLQMRLVEFYSDRANTQIRNSIKRLMEIKQRILHGAKPISLTSVLAISCRRDGSLDVNTYASIARNIEHMAKAILGIELKPLNSPHLADALANFRSVPTS